MVEGEIEKIKEIVEKCPLYSCGGKCLSVEGDGSYNAKGENVCHFMVGYYVMAKSCAERTILIENSASLQKKKNNDTIKTFFSKD